ncbi:serine hydrolase domain-containing protein [Nannocystis sp.]|uniref:serine hydrolase domain-containing protein n=1 Tax=Nannocystis sp. TaxID=1962667 RepID=UPI0025F0D7EF|nr:serine hydrolase domain-containing protein [Nannocystis sp.]MBK7826806.1 beta-lactamase family protein [Nannocystis sp.]
MSPRVPLVLLLAHAGACGSSSEASTTGDVSSSSGESSSGEPVTPTTGEAATGSDDSTSSAGSDASSSGSLATSDTGDTGETSDTGDPGIVYPEPDWQPGDPMAHGFDPAGLAGMAALAESSDSNCLVVTQGGALIGEWYWNGFDAAKKQDNVYSVTKSVTSALVGIAAEEGLLDIEAPVGFTEWAGSDSEAVTIRNLISNNSGREWSFNSDYIAMGVAPDQTQFALDLGQDKPVGTFWEYNNAAIQTLERALKTATAGPLGDYAQSRLFDAIHMSADMGKDGEGNALTYQGVSASCRDLARFGYLYLRGGTWADDVQVVPAAWVSATITPSTAFNSAYGYMWWLNRPGHWILPSVPLRTEGDGKLIPAAPDEVFAAIGAFGQFVVVDPTTDSVWVRLGPIDLGDASGFGKLNALWDAFEAAQIP